MKKNEMTLFALTVLFNTHAFSMDIDEKRASSTVTIKSSTKHGTSPKETLSEKYKSNSKFKYTQSTSKQANQSNETAPGWYSSNNKIKIKYTEVKEIGDFKGCKLYGYIDPSFTNSQWQTALDKGFTKTAKGTNGIKFINNSLFELKINGDERLYTTEVHKNDLEDYIAIFDRETRHKTISKIANKNNLKIHKDCSSNF